MRHCKARVTLGARAGVPWVGSGHRNSKLGATARNTKNKTERKFELKIGLKARPKKRTTLRVGWQRGEGMSVTGQEGIEESKPCSERSW